LGNNLHQKERPIQTNSIAILSLAVNKDSDRRTIDSLIHR
jgi:hypothetical protein